MGERPGPPLGQATTRIAATSQPLVSESETNWAASTTGPDCATGSFSPPHFCWARSMAMDVGRFGQSSELDVTVAAELAFADVAPSGASREVDRSFDSMCLS